MGSDTSPKLYLHDHPVSSYAQKVRIALREKDIPFEAVTPVGLGSGKPIPSLEAANPRVEVPALEDGDLKLFDSTVILAYLEEKYPEHPLLPSLSNAGGAVRRAQARMVEEVCDTTYEAINWAYGEIDWCGRATGALEEKLTHQVKGQTALVLSWLEEKLGSDPYFNGETFGYADLCVAPVLNRSVHYGFGPAEGSPLQLWHARISKMESVKTTFAEMAEGIKGMKSGMGKVFVEGKPDGPRREYRDHRLEFLVRSGGIDIVTEGLKMNNIRFSWPGTA